LLVGSMIRAVTNCSNTASLPHALSRPSWRYTAAIASSSLPIRDEVISNPTLISFSVLSCGGGVG